LLECVEKAVVPTPIVVRHEVNDINARAGLQLVE
jgi:hypothetical protein